jgi:hypothetical protein
VGYADFHDATGCSGRQPRFAIIAKNRSLPRAGFAFKLDAAANSVRFRTTLRRHPEWSSRGLPSLPEVRALCALTCIPLRHIFSRF